MKTNTAMVWMTLCHCIVQIVFICCITFAAISSNRYGLLWWYILPALTTVTYTSKSSNDNDKDIASNES